MSTRDAMQAIIERLVGEKEALEAQVSQVEALYEKWDDYALDPGSIEEDMRNDLHKALWGTDREEDPR